MPQKTPEELISALVDGELSPEESAQAESLLAEQPSLRAQYEELRALRASFSLLPKHTAPPGMREAVLARVAHLRPEPVKTGGETADDRGPQHVAFRRPRGVRVWLWPAAALAAGVLIMLASHDEEEAPRRVALTRQPAPRLPRDLTIGAAPVHDRKTDEVASDAKKGADSGLATTAGTERFLDETSNESLRENFAGKKEARSSNSATRGGELAAAEGRSPGSSAASSTAPSTPDAASDGPSQLASKDNSPTARARSGRASGVGGMGGGAGRAESASGLRDATGLAKSGAIRRDVGASRDGQQDQDVVVNLYASETAVRSQLLPSLLMQNRIHYEAKPILNYGGKLKAGESNRDFSKTATGATTDFFFVATPRQVEATVKALNERSDIYGLEIEPVADQRMLLQYNRARQGSSHYVQNSGQPVTTQFEGKDAAETDNSQPAAEAPTAADADKLRSADFDGDGAVDEEAEVDARQRRAKSSIGQVKEPAASRNSLQQRSKSRKKLEQAEGAKQAKPAAKEKRGLTAPARPAQQPDGHGRGEEQAAEKDNASPAAPGTSDDRERLRILAGARTAPQLRVQLRVHVSEPPAPAAAPTAAYAEPEDAQSTGSRPSGQKQEAGAKAAPPLKN